MNLIKIISTYYHKKYIDYQISKDKYKLILKLIKKYKTMTDKEIVSHLKFIYDFTYSKHVATDILKNFHNPNLSFILYKNSREYIDCKIKFHKPYKASFADKFNNYVEGIVAVASLGIFMTIFLKFNIIGNYLFATKLTIAITCFVVGILFLGSIFKRLVKINSANRFYSLRK
jgi:hypothetical protein